MRGMARSEDERMPSKNEREAQAEIVRDNLKKVLLNNQALL